MPPPPPCCPRPPPPRTHCCFPPPPRQPWWSNSAAPSCRPLVLSTIQRRRKRHCLLRAGPHHPLRARTSARRRRHRGLDGPNGRLRDAVRLALPAVMQHDTGGRERREGRSASAALVLPTTIPSPPVLPLLAAATAAFVIPKGGAALRPTFSSPPFSNAPRVGREEAATNPPLPCRPPQPPPLPYYLSPPTPQRDWRAKTEAPSCRPPSRPGCPSSPLWRIRRRRQRPRRPRGAPHHPLPALVAAPLRRYRGLGGPNGRRGVSTRVVVR